MVNEHVFMNLVSFSKKCQPSQILRLGEIMHVWDFVSHALIGIISVVMPTHNETFPSPMEHQNCSLSNDPHEHCHQIFVVFDNLS